MSYTIEKYPDLPCYLCRLGADFDIRNEFKAGLAEHITILNAVSEPVYFIHDTRAVQASFDDLLAVVGELRRQMSVMQHPMLIESLNIVPNRMVEMMIKGLTSATFGHMPVRPFTSVEAAVAYVQEQVKRKAG